jgi:hypothetical protein
MYSALVKCGPKRGYFSRGGTGFVSIELYFTCGNVKLSSKYFFLKIFNYKICPVVRYLPLYVLFNIYLISEFLYWSE